ncbi:MAG: TetR family transcriptional regulator [Anaerolineae bacterium]|nr:TetR family transcriptional regulator [Anaerolineae bacterium]
MQRATRDDQKAQRRQAILDAAWELFQGQPYEAVSVIDIARATGLAKGTVYLYFTSKEGLFLAVQAQQFAAWFDAVDAALAGRSPLAIEALVRLFAESLAARPALARLFAIAHVVLERNIDYDTARDFKRFLLERLRHTGALLEDALPFLAPGQGPSLLLTAYALVIGLQHLADPAPVVREVMRREPDLAAYDIDFVQAFTHSLTALLRGMTWEGKQQR